MELCQCWRGVFLIDVTTGRDGTNGTGFDGIPWKLGIPWKIHGIPSNTGGPCFSPVSRSTGTQNGTSNGFVSDTALRRAVINR